MDGGSRLTFIADGWHQTVGGCLGSGWAALGLGGYTQSRQVKASQDPSWCRCRAALSLCSALAVRERPLVIVQTMAPG